ncbi:MAG TPA: hypothetical protein VIS51_09985 [Solirubrobacterales bacterium]
MGYADGSVARYLEGGVAGSVALEGGAVAVKFPAVELRGEALTGPEGVDLEAEDGCVEGRGGQVVVAAEGGELVLEGERVIAAARASASRRRIGFRALRP